MSMVEKVLNSFLGATWRYDYDEMEAETIHTDMREALRSALAEPSEEMVEAMIRTLDGRQLNRVDLFSSLQAALQAAIKAAMRE